jgi:phage terminase large subunit
MSNFDVVIPYHFEARDYQIPFLKAVEDAINGESDKRFFYQIWHRRSGKDKTNIADVVPRRLIRDPCLVKYVLPTLVMGRDNLWDGIGKDGFKYTNHIPDEIRDGRPNETRMQIPTINASFKLPEDPKNPNTPSLFQVQGSDHPDSLRGGNPKLYILSEWAEHDPYAFDVIEPIVRENDGIIILNTTPKGNNHARSTFEFAKTDPRWWVETLTYKDTDVFTEDEYKAIEESTVKRFEADGRSAEEAMAYCQQEYMCSFDSPVIGSYYGAAVMKAELEHRITNVPYDQTLPVNTFWDLGMDDSMTIWFHQQAGLENHFIDYYENSGEGLPHYAKILQDKKYLYGKHVAPFDIAVREIGSGKSRLEIAKSLGIPFETAPKLDIDDGINAGRSIFNTCWFDVEKCNRGLNALKNYKKDWDEKNKVFRMTPLHNWASHGADSFRQFAVGYRKFTPLQQQTSFGGVQPYYEGMPG